MATIISSFSDVQQRAVELGCPPPQGLAVLPRNFESAANRHELIHDDTGLTVRALWRADGVPETRLEPEGETWPAAQKDSAEWVGPIIFIGSTLLSQNPDAINVGLGVTANYVTDLLRGLPPDRRTARLTVVVEDGKGSARRVDYEGPAEGMADLPKVIREIKG